MNDDDFDEPDVDVPISRFAQVAGPRSSGSGALRGNSKDQDEEDGDFGGGVSQVSSSRARMLAQQRDVLMKRRQDALEAGGMVRSSNDSSSNSPLRKSADNQFTPAVRQFSAPKSVKDASAE